MSLHPDWKKRATPEQIAFIEEGRMLHPDGTVTTAEERRRGMDSDMIKMTGSPKCPQCGFVMCEQFDDVPSETDPTVTYAVPNGGFICYHCGIEGEAPQARGTDDAQAK